MHELFARLTSLRLAHRIEAWEVKKNTMQCDLFDAIVWRKSVTDIFAAMNNEKETSA